jgi:nucleotide-binding universal stress UspA family protein
MRWASDFSELVGARLTFLHAVPSFQDAPAPSTGSDLQEELRKGVHEKFESLRQASGIGGRLQVTVGAAVETVLDEARREQADLLIIGRGLLPSPLGRLRSKAYAIIQASPCPTVSV